MLHKTIISLITILILLHLFGCDNKSLISNTNATISLSGSHCDVIVDDFSAEVDSLADSITWTSDIGTIDSKGSWAYAPTLADVNDSITVTVTATSQGYKYIATVQLDFTNDAPNIDCSYAPTNVKAGETTDFYVSATDDCDRISYSVGALTNATATVGADAGDVSVTPVQVPTLLKSLLMTAMRLHHVLLPVMLLSVHCSSLKFHLLVINQVTSYSKDSKF